MSRQIKYRFWDNEKEKMIYSETFSYLEEFTGLKDKNGNEIYEGDIVKTHGDTALSCGIFWIEISPNGVLFKRMSKTSGKEIIIKANALEYELLGNIHENSDLLTKGR